MCDIEAERGHWERKDIGQGSSRNLGPGGAGWRERNKNKN